MDLRPFPFLFSPAPVARGFLGHGDRKPAAAVKTLLWRGTHTCTLTHPGWWESVWAAPREVKESQNTDVGKVEGVFCLMKNRQSYDIKRQKVAISCFLSSLTACKRESREAHTQEAERSIPQGLRRVSGPCLGDPPRLQEGKD